MATIRGLGNISDDTWALIKERGNVRLNILACTCLIRKERLKELYRTSRREINRLLEVTKESILKIKHLMQRMQLP